MWDGLSVDLIAPSGAPDPSNQGRWSRGIVPVSFLDVDGTIDRMRHAAPEVFLTFILHGAFLMCSGVHGMEETICDPVIINRECIRR